MSSSQPRVMVDTSFLGNLMVDNATFNGNALKYFLLLQQQKAVFYIPTIVVAEYSMKGDIGVVVNALSARIESFDLLEAREYARNSEKYNWFPKKMSRAQKRDAVVDLMLISQAITSRMDIFITADQGLCNRVPPEVKLTVLNIMRPPEFSTPLWLQSIH